MNKIATFLYTSITNSIFTRNRKKLVDISIHIFFKKCTKNYCYIVMGSIFMWNNHDHKISRNILD